MSGNGEGLQVHGCLIRVPDLRIAESFYRDQLRFQPQERWQNLIRLDGTPAVFLEQVAPGPNPSLGQARVNLVLEVADLAAVSERFRSQDIPLVTGKANPLPIGLAECFLDPFGNVHTLLQLNNRATADQADFRISSIAVKTPIGLIPAARHIYEGQLGFKALTERYYPPTLPLGNREGSLAFVIHDKHPWEPDLIARAPLYPNDMGAVLIFATPDAAAVRERLASAGRVRVTGLEDFSLGLRFGIIDNAGIPSEVWEYA
jgi:catechol 2,3-dioxygenase-like lactoylglutathione lyase family enzyme